MEREEGEREREREREGDEESAAKAEVKRYIWLNGRGRATVYKAFYIYRIPVVARFLCRGDKRPSSATDLLEYFEGRRDSLIPRRPPPSHRRLQIRGICRLQGDASWRNLNWTVAWSSPS